MLKPLSHRESAEYVFVLERTEEEAEQCKAGWYYTLMSFAQGVARKQILPASLRSRSLIEKILKESTKKFDKVMWRGL